jgi:hypothetical protein
MQPITSKTRLRPDSWARGITWTRERKPMTDQGIKFDYRKWRGDKEFMGSVHRQYNFPVHVRRIGEPAPQSSH